MSCGAPGGVTVTQDDASMPFVFMSVITCSFVSLMSKSVWYTSMLNLPSSTFKDDGGLRLVSKGLGCDLVYPHVTWMLAFIYISRSGFSTHTAISVVLILRKGQTGSVPFADKTRGTSCLRSQQGAWLRVHSKWFCVLTQFHVARLHGALKCSRRSASEANV